MEGNMKISKNQFIYTVISISILVLSVAFLLIDALVPLNLWTHPFLNFLFCICLGFGALSFAVAVKKSSPWYFFLGATLFGLALIYVLWQYIPWWIGVIIVAVVLIICSLVSLISAGNQTENIALNKSKDYKNYKERKAIKDEEEKNSPKEQLPEIKSFK